MKKALDVLMPQSKVVPNLEASVDEISLVELDQIEIDAALRVAKETKFYMRKRQAYNEKVRKANVARKYTSGEILSFLKEAVVGYTRNNEPIFFAIDEDNEKIVNELCKYFSGESCSLNPDKGILLSGGVGTGKSSLMHFFSRNQIAMYRMISCRDIESDFSSEGEKSVQNCSYNLKVSPSGNEFMHSEMGYCFDDLGTEANGKHFGKEKNVMAEIILNRYDNNIPFPFTHITTNFTAKKIEAEYGPRVADRMKQMFNIVSFSTTAKSRRK